MVVSFHSVLFDPGSCPDSVAGPWAGVESAKASAES